MSSLGPDKRAKGETRMASPVAWAESSIVVAGLRMHLMQAGSGPAVLVLHHDVGTPDRLAFYDRLAERFTVLVPHHPGWGKSERPAWARHVRDLAAIYQWLLADRKIGPVSLAGLGFGGWIAAEMASLAPREFAKLVLVAPMGIKPPEGEIMDQAIVSYIAYPQAGFHDQARFRDIYGDVTTDQLEAWDIAREMCFRLAWKPYMYNPALPHLLGGVRAPALIVWGDDDRIVPRSAGEAYVRALGNARMETVRACGHFAEMEQPEELARIISQFLAA
ncbi:MAG TPA: alpha/beta hydrolase [Acetobacteraceae bacterium]|nr:alpha/beta hydrolase [Acetobacteraceae bacterium]